MNETDLAQNMLQHLSAKDHLSSDDFKLKVVLECLHKAATCFEMADKPELAEKITEIMENLSKAGE
jgi:hypothetical protein